MTIMNIIQFPIGSKVIHRSMKIATEPAERASYTGEVVDLTIDFPTRGFGRDGEETWCARGQLVRFSDGTEMWIPASDLETP